MKNEIDQAAPNESRTSRRAVARGVAAGGLAALFATVGAGQIGAQGDDDTSVTDDDSLVTDDDDTTADGEDTSDDESATGAGSGVVGSVRKKRKKSGRKRRR